MRRSRTVNVNTRRGPGLMGTMARTAVIAGTATAVSNKTTAAMTGSAQAKQGAQQAQMQAMVDEQVQQQLADQQAQMEQQQAPPPPVAMAAPKPKTSILQKRESSPRMMKTTPSRVTPGGRLVAMM